MSERIFPAAGYGFASIRISEKHIRLQKKFPGAGPQADCICNTGCENRGACAGEVWAGEAPEGPASPGEAGLSKVFSYGRTPPAQTTP